SGNLAGHLIVLANACEEWMETAIAPHARLGMMDHLQLACDAIEILPAASSKRGRQLASILEEIEAQLNGAQAIQTLSPTLKRLAERAASAARDIIPAAAGDNSPDLVFWIEALRKTVAEHERDRAQIADAPHVLKSRLNALAGTAREMALAMD